MLFKATRNLLVWDKHNDRALCQFDGNGECVTEDDGIIAELISLGYEYDGEPPQSEDETFDPDEELEALREKAKELGIKYASTKGKDKLIEEIEKALKGE